MITSLMTEFSQGFQEFAAIERDIKLFSANFQPTNKWKESVQLGASGMQYKDSLQSRHQLLRLSEVYRSLEKANFLCWGVKQWWICSAPHTSNIFSDDSEQKPRTKMTDGYLCDVLGFKSGADHMPFMSNKCINQVGIFLC